MLKSMTAYGRAVHRYDQGQFTVEIQSVNRKFLELNIFLPKEFVRFESEIRKWLQPYLVRGQVTVKISASFEDVLPVKVSPNIALANQVKQAWQQLAQVLSLKSDEVTLNLLSRMDGLLVFEERFENDEVYQHALKKALDGALNGFLQMKTREGQVLQEDLSLRLQKMQEWIIEIEKKTPQASQKYREKLIARLEEVLPGKIENEERILREVAVYAEKIDITEEITRFKSHLSHVLALMQSDQTQIGKTLEFMLQELNREINTIGSKSSDMEIARYVIDVKSELERIREQIQNVE